MPDRYLILTDEGGNYLLDEVTGDILIVPLIDTPIPGVPSGDLIDYVFQFSSDAQARHNSTTGPYFSNFALAGLNPNVLIFDRAINSTIPLAGYWLMISQRAPINATLWNHPNLQLVIDRTQEILGNASVLLDIAFPDTTTVSIMVSARGQHTAGGLFGARQISLTPADALIAEDGTFLVAEDNATFLVQE